MNSAVKTKPKPAGAKRRRRTSTLSREEIQKQALANALADKSDANYETIIEGFIEKGIDPDEVIPRVNVFTYNAWLQLGRQVRKGESGVRIVSMAPVKPRKGEDASEKPAVGEDGKSRMRAVPATVFHISQTDSVEVCGHGHGN
ncbi:ArdC family protein [Pseudomonas syringae pv. coryli]|uniref:ArdC family protein n=1 Tax=Pseudomonas syringae pv. coryli TaxID=317659 RepID=UPI003D265BD4